MEPQQTAQMVAWLDEERRKDKALISKLEERTITQAALLEDQARRIQALEGQIAGVRTAMLTTSVFDEAFSRVRQEFATVADQVQNRRDNTEGEWKKLRDMDRETTLRAIEELRQETAARLERELQIRRAEEERLSRVATELQAYANNLSKGLEEFERSLTFLEEQRRQDSRRISDINGEIVEINKRVESQKPKVELLEELSRRTERSVEQLAGEFTDFKHQRQTWIEQEALAAARREQIMADMVRRMDGFADDMGAFAKQVSGWGDLHRTVTKQLEDFDRLADRVDRRLNEVAEVQRLTEERFRQEWEEFLQDDQKRWRQFTLTNEEARREHQKAVEEVRAQMAKLTDQAQVIVESFKKIKVIQQDTIRELSNMVVAIREQAEDGFNSLPTLS